MSRTTLKRDLLKKMIIAKIDVAAYLSLRRAKGYMSVVESEHLRDNLFDLCTEYRENLPDVKKVFLPQEIASFDRGIAAISSAAVCLMTGRHDCPHYIAIDADKLESCLDQLSHSLNGLLVSQQAIEA
ncbi:biofilm formation regulator BssR [Enterobacteriaceae bacterium H20N1]|uniref:Biofilm formation regulator BssR n=1 Tax=Dryocola boscaweniae TaxID=2925397 RepID=A0A9X2W9C6_9ENTR|nr:biofilm formation regulator BssR [Dryocola boscaweniae]MCT4702523.1 biofilm formation regulator BssR [Dryocola boscaweniae]MCT4719691.1 biofilm formation regulator BssR [Dryocola boscaweniae]